MNRLAQSLVLASIVACGLAIDWKKPCELQAKCMLDAVAQRKQCDTLTATRDAKWPPKRNEAQNRSAEHGVYMAGLDYAKRNHKIDCLQKSLVNATIVSCSLAKIASCESIVNNYTTRSKRETPPEDQGPPNSSVDDHLNHPRPDESHQHDFHPGAEAPQEERRKRQANTTTTISAAAAAKAAKAAAAAAAAADKKARDDLNSQINKCWADANAIDANCGRLAGCCSENWLCDLAYLNSDLVKEYGQKQRDYQLEHRIAYPPSCPAPAAPKPAVFSNAGSGSGSGSGAAGPR